MFIVYWLLACALSVLFFVYCANIERFNWATLFIIILMITSVISMVNGIKLFCNRSDAENKQVGYGFGEIGGAQDEYSRYHSPVSGHRCDRRCCLDHKTE